MKRSLCLGLALALVSAQFPSEYKTPSQFYQCDPSWGDLHYGVIDVGTKTICEAGDKLTALAMVMDGCKLRVDSGQTNPSTLNSWLQTNNGYARKDDDSSEIVLAELLKFGFSVIGKVEGDMAIRSAFRKGAQIILKIRDQAGARWLAMRGFTSSTYIVGDPTPFSTTQVNPADVVVGETLYHPRCRSFYVNLDNPESSIE
jgi:hypothetical protein